MPLLNLRLAHPSYLIDINRVADLRSMEPANGALSFGAMVRQRAIERSDLVHDRLPLLSEVVPFIGHSQIRNRGTIGGSLAHADPAAELPAVALLLDAEFVVRSERGQRVISAADFFQTYMTTALEPDELLVEIRFPTWPSRAGWAFQEVSRRHGDFALVGAAALVVLAADGSVEHARLAFTGMGDRPIRPTEAERSLVGEQPTDAAFAVAAEMAVADLNPPADVHATSAYRTQVAKTLTQRTLAAATGRAGGAQ